MRKKIKEDNIQNTNEILYSEWVPAGRFVKIVIIFVCTLIISLGIIISTFIPKELAFIGIILGAVALLVFLLYWNFRGLKIILTREQLEIAYGKLNRKRFPLEKITNCDITKAKFRIYGGVGIRYGLDGSIAYNTDFGEAVKLFFEKGRPFLFTTRNPEKLCDLIKEFSP